MRFLCTSLGIITILFASSVGAYDDPINIATDGKSVEFLSEKTLETNEFELTVIAPDGRRWARVFQTGEIPRVSLADVFEGPLQEGGYQYEIMPRLDQSDLQVPDEMRGLEGSAFITLSAQSGNFTVFEGKVVDPNIPEQAVSDSIQKHASESTSMQQDDDFALMDFVVNDDLIVLGSACVGFDCVNDETFSFDTLKLKENNTRMTFIDTSTISGFPAGDWQLRANDSQSGGADHFSIDWLGTGANVGNAPVSTPLRVDGAAPTNSLRISSSGRIGLRTSSPVLDLHIATADTPGVRLDQTSAGGFSPQVWDVAGNEANFFVRDVTGGSRLPLRIRPGAPTSSIDIASNGNVGIGNTSPESPLHVQRTNNAAEIRIEDTGAGDLNMLSLLNNGHPVFIFRDTSQNDVRWQFRTAGVQGSNERFQINKLGSGVIEMLVRAGGNVIIAGSLTQGSSRTIKERITELDPEQVLASLNALPVHEWSYQRSPKERHLGPMAEDFHAVFGLGGSDKHIAPGDLAGVALAAAKALNDRSATLENRSASLEAETRALQVENAELRDRLEHLEALLLSRM